MTRSKMRWIKGLSAVFLLFVCVCAFVLNGCAPLLVAGGAAGGYAVAKDMEDGELIDSKKGK